MESSGGEDTERDRKEERMDGHSQEGTDSTMQDGGVQAEEDYGANEPPTQEDQPGSEQGASSLQIDSDPHYGPHYDPHSDRSGANEYSNAALYSEENMSPEPLIPHLSGLNVSEDVEDPDPLPAEGEEIDEEFIVLDPEHHLVKRQQAALNTLLSKELERINHGLREKHAMEKADKNHKLEVGVEMFRVQEMLARLQTRLEDRHHTKQQAGAKHFHTQDHLEVKKGQYSGCSSQNSKAKANVSQLQAEIDNLMTHLIFMQEVGEELHSNVKAMQNARHKAGAEQSQAAEEKLKQDMYVERLTKNMERLTQQIAMYEVQDSAQIEEAKAAKEAFSEAEMELESLVMAHRQLLQQWSSSLVGMRRRDEALSVMQEVLRDVSHQMILLDREIEGYKRSVTEEQEENQSLTTQLHWSQTDGTSLKGQISQKQAQQEVLHAHYCTCIRSLKETERTLARLSKQSNTHQTEVNDQRKWMERESTIRLELEDKIMAHMQQKLTHNKAAKYSQRLTSKTAMQKKEMVSQLWQLENNINTLEFESSQVNQSLDTVALIQGALEEEITKNNKILATSQAQVSSILSLIGQRMNSIAHIDKKIHEITASTGHEDLSPYQIKIDALMARTAELEANMNSVKQHWMKRQEILEGLSQEIDTNRRSMLKLQTEFTAMQQKKICMETLVEAEDRDEAELELSTKVLTGDLLKLNTLISKNSNLSEALEQENALTETDFLHRLQLAERGSIEMQMKQEKTQEEKEQLLNSLLEAQRQIMLWERKMQLLRDTRSAVDKEAGQGEMQMMKAEIHRMEVRLDQLMKHQERLVRESEAAVTRRETIMLRQEAMLHNSTKQTTKGELSRLIQGLQRKIQDTHKHVIECEQMIRGLQESQDSLSDRLAQQKQQLVDLYGTSQVLDPEFENLQDTKDSNLTHLVGLQSRAKRLQGVGKGSYQALSTSDSISAALQSKMERVHTVSAILHCVCQEFPHHQGALRRPARSLAARAQALEREMSSE